MKFRRKDDANGFASLFDDGQVERAALYVVARSKCGKRLGLTQKESASII